MLAWAIPLLEPLELALLLLPIPLLLLLLLLLALLAKSSTFLPMLSLSLYIVLTFDSTFDAALVDAALHRDDDVLLLSTDADLAGDVDCELDGVGVMCRCVCDFILLEC
jgi:hypothetical protein